MPPPAVVEAIVLRRAPYADTSLVLHLFCAERGRVTALAKGAFRPQSPHFAGLDLLDRIEARLVGKGENGLALLGSSTLLHSPRTLHRDAGALALALYTLELIDTALPSAPAPKLYAMFRAWLDWLNATDGATAEELARGSLLFEVRFLAELGLAPILDRCALCSLPVPAAVTSLGFSVQAGGVVCSACSAKSEHPLQLRRPSWLWLRAERGESRESAELTGPDIRDLRALLDRFHTFHLDRSLKSRPAIDAVFSRISGERTRPHA